MPKNKLYSGLLSELENIKNFEGLYFEDKLGDFEEIVESDEFYNYVFREFEKTVIYATIYDLSVFAFGGLKEALADYLEKKVGVLKKQQ